MKIFRFWWDLPLDTPFHATFNMIPKQELTDRTPNFQYIISAIKKSGAAWEIVEIVETITDSSDNRHTKVA